MKIKLELYGASREFSKKDYLEFILKEKSSINDLRNEILSFIDKNFKGNNNFKRLVETSKFCSEENNIVSDSYKITRDQKIGIIPPIGGG
jgi:molybdopterin converting factor small subunit|tara:strand:+ start:23 stop:292 length:270 start_codon:yes stop_codon:yes gene_type:complete